MCAVQIFESTAFHEISLKPNQMKLKKIAFSANAVFFFLRHTVRVPSAMPEPDFVAATVKATIEMMVRRAVGITYPTRLFMLIRAN